MDTGEAVDKGECPPRGEAGSPGSEESPKTGRGDRGSGSDIVAEELGTTVPTEEKASGRLPTLTTLGLSPMGKQQDRGLARGERAGDTEENSANSGGGRQIRGDRENNGNWNRVNHVHLSGSCSPSEGGRSATRSRSVPTGMRAARSPRPPLPRREAFLLSPGSGNPAPVVH